MQPAQFNYLQFMFQEKAVSLNVRTSAKRSQTWAIIAFQRFRISNREGLLMVTTAIALAQTLLHLFAINAYGFHEDELLYMALGEHLAWGYRETAPLIALIGNFSKWLFGDSLIAMRLLPAVCAGAVVHLTGILTIRLGGKYFAVIIACTAVAFSPAFLASGALFIPQVFDELFWLLTVYLVVCYVQKPQNNCLFGLGVIIGLGILLKYTLLLYVFGILLGLALNAQYRVLFKKKAFYWSVFIAFLILLPHLFWQINNHFPALAHYHELKKTQLNYSYRIDFLTQQLLVNGPALFIWLLGLTYLFSNKKLQSFRFIAVSFLVVMLVLALLKGKPYYGFGAYPALFAVGAIGLERWLKGKQLIKKILLSVFLIFPNLLLAVIVLPMLPIQKAVKVFSWAYNNLGIDFTVKWEDQKIHNVNQNYADMIGWDELAQKTSAMYMALTPAEKKKTIIYTESYGIASALTYYSKHHPMPKVVSLNGSFAEWAPEKINGNIIIFCGRNNLYQLAPSRLLNVNYFVTNRFSRLYGDAIFLLKKPAEPVYKAYLEDLSRARRYSY